MKILELAQRIARKKKKTVLSKQRCYKTQKKAIKQHEAIRMRMRLENNF